ncbi:MAG: SDR family NAD(P)-dependent oxidoreductase [Pseudomonadota bacterium]
MTIKKILITGATDGIGLEAAKLFTQQGHHLCLHGRNPTKLNNTQQMLIELNPKSTIESYPCDLSLIKNLPLLTNDICSKHKHMDVLINNAGVLKTDSPTSAEGLDVRFVVNTIAPYYLTRQLLPLLNQQSRVINLSSAAQAPLNTDALLGRTRLSDMDAYAQSKLAIALWSYMLGLKLKQDGPMVAAVNPGSLLATKMVKEGFGLAGGDVGKGADILVRAALSADFEQADGQYFDNDTGQFAPPHQDALDTRLGETLIHLMDKVVDEFIH